MSSAKGIFVFVFLTVDIIFAIFQTLPLMGITFFSFCYLLPYLLTYIFFVIVSTKDPGYVPKEKGNNLLKLLKKEKVSVK